MPVLSLDELKQSKGFRQHDPGVYTNDEAFGQGQGYVVDSGPTGYKQVALSGLNIGTPSPPPTPPPPPVPPPTVAASGPGFVGDTQGRPVPTEYVPPAPATPSTVPQPAQPPPTPTTYDNGPTTAARMPVTASSLPPSPPDWAPPVITPGPTSSPTGSPTTPTVPSGGNLKDPTYVDALIAYWAGQPGANPSLSRDPNYWRNKILSGELGPDEKYIISKFLLPEGAPAGSTGTKPPPSAPTAPAGAYLTPEGTWITAQYDPGVWIDNKNQLWVLDANGKPVKKGAGPTPAPAPLPPTTPPPPPAPPSVPGRDGVPGVPIDPNATYPGNLFNDPGTKLLEDTIKARLNELFAPVNDPALAQLNKLITDNLDRLNDPNDPSWRAITDLLNKRIADLQAPVYTSQQEEAVKTKLFDQQEQDRQAEIQAAIERLASHGVGKSSGVIAAATDLVNKRYDAARATTQNTFATDTIAEQQRRADEALQLGGTLYDAQQSRAGQAIGLGGSLYDLSNGITDQETARRREALGLISTLSDIPGQRLQLAEQASGMAVNPSSISDQIMKLMTNSQTQTENAANRRQSLVSGIGQIVGTILAGAASRPSQPKAA